MQSVAPFLAEPPNAEIRASLATALHYFREAAAKHNADEEESLFPRLRQAADVRGQAVLDKLADLEDEHRWAVLLHEQLDQIGGKFLVSGGLSPEEVETFRSAVARLVSMYRSHIAFEDEVFFPCAAEILSAKDKAAIAGEMASRRYAPDCSNCSAMCLKSLERAFIGFRYRTWSRPHHVLVASERPWISGAGSARSSGRIA